MRRTNQNNRAGWPLLGGLLILAVGAMLLLSWLGNTARAQGSGYALRFYGHGTGDIDRVKIKIDPQVPADVGGNFTIEFWMKANLADNNNSPTGVACDTFKWVHGHIILDRDIWDTPSSGGDFGISVYNGKIRFGAGNSSLDQTICGGTNVADGQWHHIAVTRKNSNGQMRIYVDGKQDAQGTGPSGNISYTDGRSTSFEDDPFLVIGAEKHDAGGSFPSYNGLIDELRISNSIRYSSNFTPPSSPFSTDGNTMALYHFDEGPGNCTGTVTDSSGASGGPSNGTCWYGGSGTSGPVYTTDTPFGGSAPPATNTPVNPPTATPDTSPPDITNVAASPLDTIVTIRWNTDEPATSRVTYGSSTLDMSTTETTSYVTEHSVLLTGLNPDTSYVFQVHSKDATGNSVTSTQANFTTLAVDEVSHVYLPLVLK